MGDNKIFIIPGGLSPSDKNQYEYSKSIENKITEVDPGAKILYPTIYSLYTQQDVGDNLNVTSQSVEWVINNLINSNIVIAKISDISELHRVSYTLGYIKALNLSNTKHIYTVIICDVDLLKKHPFISSTADYISTNLDDAIDYVTGCLMT